jgi:hypothetical protein
VNIVSKEFTGQHARTLPTYIVKGIAIAGDLLKKLNVPFPITSSRFNSMTQDYLTNIAKTYNAFGSPPYSTHEGVKTFIQWYYRESSKAENPFDRKLKVTTG